MKSTPKKAPDGGWGWVVVFCCFFYHMMGGAVYSMSVFYPIWLEQFQENKGVTSWVIATWMTCRVGLGPVSASLGTRFGYRIVTVIGGFFYFFGFFLSTFADSIFFLILTIGIVAGFGAGACFVPNIAILAQYFDKKRSMAVGIGTSGTGVGAFVMPSLLVYLEEHYSWRGAVLIMSAVMLNVSVCGLLMRPLGVVEEEDKEEVKPMMVINEDPYHSALSIETTGSEQQDVSETGVTGSNGFVNVSKEGDDVSIENYEDENRRPRAHSMKSTQKELGTVVENGLPERPEIRVDFVGTNSLSVSSLKNEAKLSIKQNGLLRFQGAKLANKVMMQRKDHLFQDTGHELSNSLQHLKVDDGRMCKRKFSSANEIHLIAGSDSTEGHHNLQTPSVNTRDLMFFGSVYSLIGLGKPVNPTTSKFSLAQPSTHDQSILHSGSIISMKAIATQKGLSCFSKFLEVLSTYAGLLKDKYFLIFCISNFLVNLSYLMPVIYMVDRAEDNGISTSKAAIALSMYGAGNLVGRLLSGWLADCRCLNRAFLYMVCLLVCGLSTCLSCLAGGEIVLHVMYGLVFGIFIGSYTTLTPVVLADMFGLALVGESLGLCLFFMSVATLIGTPLAGWVSDMTGDYVISYILHGSFLLMSALLLIPIVTCGRKRKGPNQEEEVGEEEVEVQT